jgi:hypothetical protein
VAAASNAVSRANNYEFISKLVAFYLDSTIGVELKSSFGRKWTNDAICHLANKMHSHVVSIVMRKVIQWKSKAGQDLDQYEVVWEYTSLGESALFASDMEPFSLFKMLLIWN